MESKVSAILSSVFKHFEEFELRVKPLGVEVVVERDEMDENDLRELLRVLDELRRKGFKIELRINPTGEVSPPSIQAVLSVSFV
ncbi:MAG: hypothetical protein DRJ66_00865 [Thermoprotei archaeon]|nr:MAG: hypothetical protein DRJ66_00865 [Thermoprotei archaeon]RLF20957.1 MAG: hypothetical protein DRZ82_00750 [Thermoprotei archaeon]